MKKILNLSVHQLVDFVLRTGDIDNRIFNATTMNEGTLIHSYYQARQGKNYISEYHLLDHFYDEDFEIILDGRADGIIIEDDKVIIDEIKSTVSPLEDFYNEQGEWHLGQAKCYALMYAKEQKLDSISIKLTYIHQLDKSQLIKTFDFLTVALEEDVKKIIHEYIVFFKLIYEHSLLRNDSAENLQFPYGDFRPGQRKLAKYSYSIAKNGGVLFAEAPTGIGKTISTLFPFVKSFADGENEKIFYLTAKNSGKEMAYDATKLMVEKGLEATAITIMAKEKVCKCPGKACNPDECPFAKGYYSKIKDVIKDSIEKYKMFSTEDVEAIAEHYAICPFELSLDLSLYVDIIICDYNYFFDPMVYLKRYFDNDASNMLVLVDEAHNLVERGRNMYSASFDTFKYKQVKHSLRHFEHKKIKNAMKRITKLFNNYESFPIGCTKIGMLSRTELNAIEAYLLAASDVNKNHHSVVTDEFTDFYFDLSKFNRLLDFYDDTFSLYVSKKNDTDWSINLYCIDPSKHLKRTLDQVKGKIIFSATLSPSDYYVEMIGGTNKDPILFLPSPFPKENLRLMVAPKISIKYKNRNDTISEVFEYISELVNGKVGNYFIYTPSYEYLDQLAPYLSNLDANLIIQEKDMTETEKKQFLSCFVENPTKTTIGLAVVGGAFGEGIDLVGDRIIGVVVIGVGLPQICFERDVIKDYFNKVENKGFNYAYISPGLNKVMQAIGRVIRSEKDRGVALLIDNRYLTEPYNEIFNSTYRNYKVVMSKEDIKEQVENFWGNK